MGKRRAVPHGQVSVPTPAILGRLDPPPGWADQPGVGHVISPHDQQPLLGNDGRPLKAYPGLPDVIQYDVISPEILESWFRIHNNFSYQDVWNRLASPPAELPPNLTDAAYKKALKNFTNMWNNRRSRECRNRRALYCWVNKSKSIPLEMEAAVQKISQIQLDHNTVWTVDQANGILHEPWHPENWVPWNHFLDNGQFPHQPPATVVMAFQKAHEHTQHAQALGKENFTKLDPKDRPAEWYSRRKDKGESKGVKVKRSMKHLRNSALTSLL